MTTETITVLLVDDHPVVRAGLRALLQTDPTIEVVGEAADGQQAVERTAELEPDVVLMDLQMPELGGAEATRRLLELDRPPKVLVVTVYDSDADILPAIEAGAVGYLLKDAPPQQLLDAIRSAARGEAVLAPRIAARLLQRSRRPRHRELTVRELEILRYLSQGLSNRAIAHELVVTEATVKTHLVHIYDKLDVDNRTAAVATARERGHLPRD